MDYVSGKMSHEEFEAELNIDPKLWDEIQSLVPDNIFQDINSDKKKL